MNVKFYKITTALPPFASASHSGIFVWTTGETKSGLYFGGASGWEYLTNDTADLDVAEFALATDTNGVVTIKGIKEVDGKIAVGTDTSKDVTFAKVATTGAAADVSITDTDGNFAATDVEGALAELATTAGSHNVATIDNYTAQTGEYATKKIEFFDGIQTNGALGTGETAAETLYFTKDVTAGDPLIVKSDLSGVVGAMVYQGSLGYSPATIQSLPTASDDNKGYVYVVSTADTYNGKSAQVGDMFVSNGSSWDLIQGTVNVTNSNPTIEAGANSASTIGTVEGVALTASVRVGGGSASSATIASKAGNVVTIKTGVTQAANTGVIGNDSGTDIVLKEVAVTGAAKDVSVADSGNVFTAYNVEGVLAELNTKITNANITIDGYKGAIKTGYGLTDVAADGDSFGVKIDSTNTNGLSVGNDGVALALAANNSGTGTAGAMSGADKVKLDGIANGAEVNTIESVSVDGTTLTISNENVNIVTSRTLILANASADGSDFVDGVTITDTYTMGGSAKTSAYTIGSNNGSIAFDANDTDKEVYIDLVWIEGGLS